MTITENCLKNIIIEAIKRILSEDHTINNSVEDAADWTIKYIKDNIFKQEVQQDETGNYYSLSVSTELENIKVQWSVRANIVKDKDEYSRLKEVNSEMSEGRSYSDGRYLFFGWIEFYVVDNWLSALEVSDTIYHELTHLLKSLKAKKYIGNEKLNSITNTEYNSKSGLEKVVAAIMYLSREDEQDAYINGLYAQLKQNFYNGDLDIRKAFVNSALYGKLMEVQNSENEIRSNIGTKELGEIISRWNTNQTFLTKRKLLSLAENIYPRMERKLASMFKHFQQLLLKNGMKINPGQGNSFDLFKF